MHGQTRPDAVVARAVTGVDQPGCTPALVANWSVTDCSARSRISIVTGCWDRPVGNSVDVDFGSVTRETHRFHYSAD